jgi:hypothetical protein
VWSPVGREVWRDRLKDHMYINDQNRSTFENPHRLALAHGS